MPDMTTYELTMNGKPLQERVLQAETFIQRLLGLMGKTETYPLHFPRCGSIHTLFMRCAIDVVFLDPNGYVVKVVPGLRPWRTAFSRHAASVLELPAGRISEWTLKVGDRLQLR